LNNTRDVGSIEILSEESVSAGTRRITALTGPKAIAQRTQIEKIASEACAVVGCEVDQLAETAHELMLALRKLKKLASGTGNEAAPAKIGVGQPGRKPSKANPEYRSLRTAVRQIARMINVSIDDVPARLQSMLAEQEALHRQLSQLKTSGSMTADDLLAKSELIGGVRLIVAETPGANPGLMRQWIDQLRKRGGEPVAVLLGGHSDGDKVTLIAGLSQALVERQLSAGKWIGPVAEVVGGGGGGKADLAQAGGKDPSRLPEAMETAKRVWREMVGEAT